MNWQKSEGETWHTSSQVGKAVFKDAKARRELLSVVFCDRIVPISESSTVWRSDGEPVKTLILPWSCSSFLAKFNSPSSSSSTTPDSMHSWGGRYSKARIWANERNKAAQYERKVSTTHAMLFTFTKLQFHMLHNCNEEATRTTNLLWVTHGNGIYGWTWARSHILAAQSMQWV